MIADATLKMKVGMSVEDILALAGAPDKKTPLFSSPSIFDIGKGNRDKGFVLEYFVTRMGRSPNSNDQRVELFFSPDGHLNEIYKKIQP
jgi:hypothetical protein